MSEKDSTPVEETKPEEEESRESHYVMDARDIDDLCTMMTLGVDPHGNKVDRSGWRR
jgi:hypothetical protein